MSGGMRASVALVAAIANLVFASAVHAQSPAIEAARKDIEATYDFDPGTMTFSQQAERAPSLSKLWDRYNRSRDDYAAALRQALAVNGQRELLYCDGGMLLLAKSTLPEDRRLALASVGKCSLAEIEQTPYFYTLHQLAREGFDTLDMQYRMLEKPHYAAYIVAHAMNLGQNYAFIYPLLVQDESGYVPRIMERLKTEADPTAIKTLTMALYYAATPQSEAALRVMARAGSRYPAAVREAAEPMVKRIDEVRSPMTLPVITTKRLMVGIPGDLSSVDLRARRKARMRSISDEALMELEVYTAMLYRTFGG
jgi:hypothetical protein